MKFSILKNKITPEMPVMQVGFASRTHKSLGIHDDIYASVVIMQANETAIIIALDLCYGDRSFANTVKEAINRKYGLTQDKVIISYSHTHSAVAVKGETRKTTASEAADINEADGAENIIYCNLVRDKIMVMLEEGFENLIDGDIYILKGKSKFGVSRRLLFEGKALWKPNFDENCIDKDLFLLKFVDIDGKIRGLVYNYACHPTTLGPDNYYISADFPGVVRSILEERNPGMTAVFLQGCGADIKPYITAGDGKFKSCSFDELEQAGSYLADEVQGYLAKMEWRKISAEFKTGCCDIKLYNEIWSARKWEELLNDPKEPLYMKQSAEKILIQLKENAVRSFLPFYISFLRLDEQTCFVCLECEILSEMGKEIKMLFNEDLIVLGYTNSRSCYIPTRKVIFEGGYESMSFVTALLSGPFVPEVEDIIVGRTALIIKS